MSKRQITSLGKLPLDWRVVSLPEYVFFQEGPGLRKWQWTTQGMKVINVTNILSDGSVDLGNTARFISVKEYQSKYSHFSVEDGDTIVASSGNTYGKVGRVNSRHLPVMMNTSVIRFHPLDSEILHPDFLYSFLRSPIFKDQVESYVVGSAQPNFGPYHLKRMFLPLPSFDVQKRIAEIIGAYDRLIENNSRRIKTLEEMVQMTFREWFVHFRYPGHVLSKLIDSPLGRIPNTWRIEPLEALCTRITDGSHWSPTTVESGRPMASSKDMHRWGLSMSLCRAISDDDFDDLVRNDCKPLAGDVLITKDGANYLKFCFAVEKDMEVVILSSIALLRPNPVRLSSLYLSLCLSDPAIKSRLSGRVSGVAIPRIVLKDFRSFRIAVPPISLQAEFDRIVSPISQLCRRLIDRNTNLRTTRDFLLPKLVSGEVSVDCLETEPATRTS